LIERAERLIWTPENYPSARFCSVSIHQLFNSNAYERKRIQPFSVIVMMSAWTKFRNALRAFRGAHTGNVAIIFAIATLPIIAGVGFAVDYSRANAVKAAMQSALDATALMISKEAATDTAAQLQTNAQKYFLALFTQKQALSPTVTASYTTTGGTEVMLNGTADVPTSLLGIIGYNTITVTGSSTTKWGSNRLRVALVLDNTGSMADNGKMPALQAATKSLLTQLQNAVTVNGDVYVSIVPFVKDVNLGASNWNSNYIYWGTVAQDPSLADNNSWDANNGSCSIGNYSTRSSCISQSSCSISGYSSQSSCTGAGTCSLSGHNSQSSCTAAGTCSISGSGHNTQSTCTTGVCSISGKTTQSTCTAAGTCSISGKTTQSTCTSAGVCSKSQYTTSSTCSQHSGTWTAGTWTVGVWTPPGTWTAGNWTPGVWSTATWTPQLHNTWNGCVEDRGNSTAPDTTNNYDTNVASPNVTINSSLYAAEQSPYCSTLPAAMELSYDWSSMNSLVNAMSPNGSTNQAIGLQLGWLSLTGGGPFTVPAMDPSYTYTQVIILLTDGLNTQDRWYGDGSTTSTQVDARQTLTCSNIKAAGITLYTIQVNTGGDPTSTLLQGCASSADKFFLLTSASQIMTVFTQIGTTLSQLRVAK
jgi:Flp pilus assembly protein TadG